jgi:hypothetical protein
MKIRGKHAPNRVRPAIELKTLADSIGRGRKMRAPEIVREEGHLRVCGLFLAAERSVQGRLNAQSFKEIRRDGKGAGWLSGTGQEAEHLADALSLLWIDGQPPAARVEVIAQEDVPTGPLALLPRGHLLVARALRNDLALELGKG